MVIYFSLIKHVLEWHKSVLLDQSDAAGQLRRQNVRIGGSPLIPVEHQLVPAEMAKMIAFLREGPRSEMDPVEFAALAHHACTGWWTFYSLKIEL